MNEHEISADFASEGMNNFYFRMPGGGYRYQGGKGFMDAVYDDNRRYFALPTG